MIYRCPSCGLAYAVPEHYAGAICLCLTPGAAGRPAPSPAASTLRPASADQSGDGPAPAPTYGRSGGGGGSGARPQGSPSPPAKPYTGQKRKDLAEWMKQVFYAKKETGNRLDQDGFRAFTVAAGKHGYAFKQDGKINDWFRGLVESHSAAGEAKATAILTDAGFIEGHAAQTIEDAPVGMKEFMRKALAALEKAGKPLKEADWTVECPTLHRDHIDGLLSLGLIWEPKVDEGYLPISVKVSK